jgi:hypothetical protein
MRYSLLNTVKECYDLNGSTGNVEELSLFYVSKFNSLDIKSSKDILGSVASVVLRNKPGFNNSSVLFVSNLDVPYYTIKKLRKVNKSVNEFSSSLITNKLSLSLFLDLSLFFYNEQERNINLHTCLLNNYYFSKQTAIAAIEKIRPTFLIWLDYYDSINSEQILLDGKPSSHSVFRSIVFEVLREKNIVLDYGYNALVKDCVSGLNGGIPCLHLMLPIVKAGEFGEEMVFSIGTLEKAATILKTIVEINGLIIGKLFLEGKYGM